MAERYCFLFLIICFWLHNFDCHAESLRPVMRISVENTASHVQSQAVGRFAAELSKRLGNRFDVQFYDAARLYRDQDVFSAISAGRLEMAVPGSWHVAKYEPNIGIFLLPEFYGRDAGATYAVLNSPVGRNLDKRIEDALDVHVLGSWLELGHAHLFMRKKITSQNDLKGLRVRVAGGLANELRLQAFGAQTLSISWPDFAIWLTRGDLDGTLTTYESVRSARLWEKGLLYVYEDCEYFPMYVPIISNRFWNRLTPEVRAVIEDAWVHAANWERDAARLAQVQGKAELVAHQAQIVVPDKQEIRKWRTWLMAKDQEFISRLGLDRELVVQAITYLQD